MTDHTEPSASRTPSKGAPAYLTPKQASAATGITVFSLAQYRQLRKRGVVRGPDFVRQGRAVRYTTEAVDAFLSARAEG